MVIFQKFFSILISVILAVSTIAMVIAFRLPNQEIYKDSLTKSSIYSKSSELVGGSSLENVDFDRVLTFLIFERITEDLVTDSWLENQTDKNLKLLESWFLGENDNLQFFFPYDDFEKSVSQNINQDIINFVDKNRSSVRICNSAREKEILANGFKKGEKFCIPISVRDGEETFSNYILGSSPDPLLKKLYPETIFKNTSGVFEASELDNTKKISQTLSPIRDISLFLRKNLVFLSIILAVLVVINFSWVYLLKKSILAQLEKILLISSVLGILLTTASILIFAFGGTIQSLILSIIPYPFATDSVVSLLSTSVFQILFSLLLPLFFINSVALIVGLALTLTRRIGLFDSIKTKNKKLHAKINNGLAPSTLDGSFHSALKKENLLRSFGGNPLLKEYDREKAAKEVKFEPDKVSSKVNNSQTPQSKTEPKNSNPETEEVVAKIAINENPKNLPINNPEILSNQETVTINQKKNSNIESDKQINTADTLISTAVVSPLQNNLNQLKEHYKENIIHPQTEIKKEIQNETDNLENNIFVSKEANQNNINTNPEQISLSPSKKIDYSSVISRNTQNTSQKNQPSSYGSEVYSNDKTNNSSQPQYKPIIKGL